MRNILCAAAALAVSVPGAHAAVISSDATSGTFTPDATNADIVDAWGGNPILAGNLAQIGTMSLLSGDYVYGGSVANLNDGKMISGTATNTIQDTGYNASFTTGSQIKLALNGAYDIAKIETFTAYSWNRIGQKYDIHTSTDGGTTWSASPLVSVEYINTGWPNWLGQMVTIQDSSPGTAIATNVDALKFTIYDNDTNQGFATSIFNEIAVYAVPEPGAGALVAMGLAALLLRRKRKYLPGFRPSRHGR